MTHKVVTVVGAVIYNAAGEVLCAQRSTTMALPGLWEFPGGKLQPGESPQQALRREIAEELGCEIEVGDRIIATTHPYPHAAVRLTTYWARLVRGTPRPLEHARLAWVPVAKLARLQWAPADLPTVRRLVEIDRPPLAE